MKKIKVFVSSVQKELENERLAVTELVSSDPFLDKHLKVILFEQLPASANSSEQAYLDALGGSEIYLGIIGLQYGRKGRDGMSATEREYREALKQKIPTYFFVKGDNTQDKNRDDEMKALFNEIRDEQNGHVYKRFSHYQSLKSAVREVLVSILESKNIFPTQEENEAAIQTIAQASDFDSNLVNAATEDDLQKDLCIKLVSSSSGTPENDITETDVRRILRNRGMLWKDTDTGVMHPTTAGLLLLGKKPEELYPQVRIAANAYGGTERGEPIDRDDIREALPIAIDRTFQFLKRNMKHVPRVIGFKTVEIHEYPYEALREAVVNAVAHRDYNLQGSCVRVEKYANRIEIISPGLPPDPITLRKIQNLNYIACSRNPNLARGLSFFEKIEEQGDGLRRIVRETEKIGLSRPEFRFRDGHFQITFSAPENMDKVKHQGGEPIFEVTDSILSELSNTQKKIIKLIMKHKQTKVPVLAKQLNISDQAVRKALKPLVEEKMLIKKEGKARDTVYSLREELPE